MNILLVDDERQALEEVEKAVSVAVPMARCFSFQNSHEALAFAETTPIDIVFLDINMRFVRLFMDGIFASQALSNLCPDCNIIYCIASDEYVKDVPRIRKSAHLIKPITSEKVQDVLSQLRYPLSE